MLTSYCVSTFNNTEALNPFINILILVSFTEKDPLEVSSI